MGNPRIEVTPGSWVIRLQGPLCASSAADFLLISREAVAGPAIELHCAEVDRVDAAGLQVLLALQAAMRKAGKPLRLIAPSSALLGALELCNLTNQFVQGGL